MAFVLSPARIDVFACSISVGIQVGQSSGTKTLNLPNEGRYAIIVQMLPRVNSATPFPYVKLETSTLEVYSPCSNIAPPPKKIGH